ncbi:MAG: hypothetical protein EOO16_25135 [Chitinophagaceae bacterium]|nr:MAG: hypothetical protein EOO16_25135 [Chitinophagaceae bacterium]
MTRISCTKVSACAARQRLFRWGFALLLLAGSAPAAAQEADDYIPPPLLGEGKVVRDFLPSGWRIIGQASGDLNGDRRPDRALVLEDSTNFYRRDNADSSVFHPRLILVLLRQPSGGYRLRTQGINYHLIAPRESGGCDDPFDTILIKKGMLEVQLHQFCAAGGWESGTSLFRFIYRGGAFPLHSARISSMHRATHAFTRTDYDAHRHRKVLYTEAGEGAKGKTVSTRWPEVPLLHQFSGL